MCDTIKIRDNATLYCDIPGIDHEWHYDREDNITWKSSPPPVTETITHASTRISG
jgi:hypothetical protein